MTQDASSAPGPTDAKAIADFYGSEFLDYVLYGHSAEMTTSNSPFLNHATSMLTAIMLGARSETDPHNQRFRTLRMLATAQANGLTIAQSLRGGMGASPSKVESSDAVVVPLTELAHAIFPLLSIPRAEGHRSFGIGSDISMMVYGHPAFHAALSSIIADPILTTLFPQASGDLPSQGDPALYQISMQAIWSTGMGGGVQLVMLPASALEYCYTRLRLGGPGVETIEAAVTTVVGLMRSLARDRRASVPAVVGLTNIQVAPGEDVTLRGGRLLNAASLAGVTSAFDSETSALLVLDSELRILDVFPPAPDGTDPDFEEVSRRFEHRREAMQAAGRALEREIVRARLAIAFGSPAKEHYAAVVRTRWMPNPFIPGGGGWSQSPIALSGSPAAVVSQTGAAAIRDWSHRVAHLPESMWLGARRLVGAIADRLDPLDAFVDAVVCWENLLGAESEVTFRLCAGLAWLLEPDDSSARSDLFNELRDLYGVRSGLVHGSREPSDKKAGEYRTRAIEIALIAMRTVFDRPELLEAKNSGERNRRLMLGA